MSSEETIGLAEAVAIWLDTGRWPNVAAPCLCQGPDSWNKPDACSFERVSNYGYTQSATFHKDQRFIKPVERKSCAETIDELYEEHDGERRYRRIIGILANRIDELERKAK